MLGSENQLVTWFQHILNCSQCPLTCSKVMLDVLFHVLWVRQAGRYVVVRLWLPESHIQTWRNCHWWTWTVSGENSRFSWPNLNIIQKTAKTHRWFCQMKTSPIWVIRQLKRVWRQAPHCKPSCVLGCPIIQKDICELIGLSHEAAGILKVAF